MSDKEVEPTPGAATGTPSASTAALETAALETAALETAALETAALETAALETAALETAALETAALETAALETAALETAALETAALETAALAPAGAERARRWASTMAGTAIRSGETEVVLAHAGPPLAGPVTVLGRAAREDLEDAALARGATRAVGAGNRAMEEEPDPWRTCFERDRDRILHATAFRRLAGKTQVFVHPADHQRTRLTHALEVAQVATAIARACRLNVALVEAIALAHDCGHGPGGHASEDALSPFVEEGYDHAVWGADVVLTPLNLCVETLDGVRSHSWSRPAPATPEGEVVSWADRIAYVCHDFEDAVAAGIVDATALPPLVASRCGVAKRQQLDTFIRAVVTTIVTSGRVGMDPETAEALAAFRDVNYRRIYLRPASVRQAESVVAVLQALVEHFAEHPGRMAWPGAVGVEAGSPQARRAAVTWVGGMTDRYAFATAVTELGWDPARLPRAVDGT